MNVLPFDWRFYLFQIYYRSQKKERHRKNHYVPPKPKILWKNVKISAWSNDNIRTLSYALRWLVKLSRDHIPAIWLVYRERLDPSIATCAKYWRASESFGGQWLGWWVSAFPIVQCKIFTQKNRDKNSHGKSAVKFSHMSHAKEWRIFHFSEGGFKPLLCSRK